MISIAHITPDTHTDSGHECMSESRGEERMARLRCWKNKGKKKTMVVLRGFPAKHLLQGAQMQIDGSAKVERDMLGGLWVVTALETKK